MISTTVLLEARSSYSAHTSHDDRHLLQRLHQGDPYAFQEMYQQYAPLIYRYIGARLDNPQDVEDLVAEVFVRAWEALPSFEWRGAALGAWLIRIAHNKVVDRYRKQGRCPLLLPIHPDMPIRCHAGRVEQVSQRDEVDRLLAMLSEEQQIILYLRFFESYSHKEIARFLHKSPTAVRVAQHRALRVLRNKLEDGDDYDGR